jgi:hypothetical protein
LIQKNDIVVNTFAVSWSFSKAGSLSAVSEDVVNDETEIYLVRVAFNCPLVEPVT